MGAERTADGRHATNGTAAIAGEEGGANVAQAGRDRYHETLAALRAVTDERDRLRAAIHEWSVAERAVQAAQDIDEGMAATGAVVLAGGVLLDIDAALKGPDHA